MKRIGRKSKKWLQFRREYLKKHRNEWGTFNCTVCHIEIPYPEVDHIKKRSTHPELVFDESNLQILCHWCHLKKSLAEQ